MKHIVAILLLTLSTTVFASHFGLTPTYESRKASEKLYDMDKHKYNYEKDDEEDN